MFDVNGDGSLSPEELQVTMKRLGFPKTLSQVHQIITKVDEDCNGVIDFLEFVSLMQMQRDETSDLKRAFAVFDKNGDVSFFFFLPGFILDCIFWVLHVSVYTRLCGPCHP